MSQPREKIVSAIVKARAELEEALYELEKLPAVSQNTVGFAAHALNNFLTLTGRGPVSRFDCPATRNSRRIRSERCKVRSLRRPKPVSDLLAKSSQSPNCGRRPFRRFC
jgi:hypothetical protein